MIPGMRKRAAGAAVTALCGAFVVWGLGTGPARAQSAGAQAGSAAGAAFDLSSLVGNYATVGQGDGGVAAVVAIGSLAFDGQGAFIGQLEQNEPNQSPACGERPTRNPSVIGSYFVEPNGRGGGSLTITSNNTSVTTDFALIITDSVGSGSNRQGRDVSLILEAPDPVAGGITRFSLTRRPLLEGGFIDVVDGSFATTCIGLGGQISEGGVGLLEFVGGGNGTGLGGGSVVETVTANMPGPTYDSRMLVEVQRFSTFSFDPVTGIGTIIRPNTFNARFLVTRARIVNGSPRATELFVTEQQLDPTTGNLVVQTARLLD